MRLRTALRLGRVSNVPTVWTDVLAGLCLAGAPFSFTTYAALALALSLFYTGGMYLNDAFDRRVDAVQRPERPIPSGEVSAAAVFAAGFGLLASGLALLSRVRPPALPLGLALAAAIVFYDLHHKKNPLSPLVMGLCRMLVYLCAAGSMRGAPLAGGLVLLSYLIGLTYAAKQEHLGRVSGAWPLAFLAAPLAFGLLRGGALLFVLLLAASTAWAVKLLLSRRRADIGRAVGHLIAGIALVDAVAIATTGATWLALAAVLGFLLTLALQRLVPGT